MELQAPNFLLVGGTGRNSGKTEFSCAVIRLIKDGRTVVGLKVTTFVEGDEAFHGSRDAHAAARHFPVGYQIVRENEAAGDKDTSRMLQAGADRVYWLRARMECLADGIQEVFRFIEPDELVVCESNSLRHVLRPDLFIVVKDATPEIKPTCLGVIEKADLVVVSDGKSFSVPPEAVGFFNGGWALSADPEKTK